MSLRDQILAVLATPAAAAANDVDTHRRVAQLLDEQPALAPVLCPECKDAEARYWRRRVELTLGDTDEVKGATHTRLRRMLSLTMQELGVDVAAAQRERDALAGDLAVATDRLASLEHAIEVFAELLATGDLDSLRMHLDHIRDVREVARG